MIMKISGTVLCLRYKVKAVKFLHFHFIYYTYSIETDTIYFILACKESGALEKG